MLINSDTFSVILNATMIQKCVYRVLSNQDFDTLAIVSTTYYYSTYTCYERCPLFGLYIQYIFYMNVIVLFIKEEDRLHWRFVLLLCSNKSPILFPVATVVMVVCFFSVWSLHVLPIFTWVFSGNTSLLEVVVYFYMGFNEWIHEWMGCETSSKCKAERTVCKKVWLRFMDPWRIKKVTFCQRAGSEAPNLTHTVHQK